MRRRKLSVECENALRRFNLATLRREARKKGAAVEGGVYGRSASYSVELPAGKLWLANGLHCLIVQWDTRQGQADRNAAVADALSRMAYGVGACDGVDCEYCRPEE